MEGFRRDIRVEVIRRWKLQAEKALEAASNMTDDATVRAASALLRWRADFARDSHAPAIKTRLTQVPGASALVLRALRTGKSPDEVQAHKANRWAHAKRRVKL